MQVIGTSLIVTTVERHNTEKLYNRICRIVESLLFYLIFIKAVTSKVVLQEAFTYPHNPLQ